ncbi:DUF2341 domain-containing protein, partial [Fibrobacterota bacterium]
SNMISIQEIVAEDYINWPYSRIIALNTTASGANVSTTVTNFPLLVRLTSANFNFGQAMSNGEDIRFTDAGDTHLDYEIERWDNSVQEAELWVLVPSITGNSTTNIKMYWGNSSAGNRSSPGSVFQTGNGFQGVWHLHNSLQDATSQNYGTPTGSDTVTALISGGRSFDGADDYVSVGPSSSLGTLTNGFTVSAWFKADDLSGAGHFFAASRNATNNGFGFGTNGADLRFRTFSVLDYDDTQANLSPSAWYHATAVMGTDDDVDFYVNGAHVSTVSHTASGNANTDDPFYLGATVEVGEGFPSELFDGILDEVRVSSSVRDSAWIKLCYESQRADQTIWDVAPPVVSGLSPADDTGRVSLTADLVITFDEVVDVETGSITIRHISDDTPFETFNLPSPARVTGTGTTTITINPSSTFASETGYYVEIDADAFDDPAHNSFAGISGPTTWNFLTADTTAPSVGVDSLSTNDNTPALTGTVNDNTASVTLSVGGQTGLAAVNNGDGTWTLADNTLTVLSDGTYNVVATAADSVGNTGTDGTGNELTVDATAPVITITTLATSDNTPALTGLVGDAAAAVSVSVGGQTGLAAVNNGDGTWSLADNTLTALSDGTYDVSATATDLFSNSGSDATSGELTIDATAPVVTANSLTTNDAAPPLTGTVTDPTAAILVSVAGQDNLAAVNNGDGTWALADNTLSTLADGSYDVDVSATDSLGNTGTHAGSGELTVDSRVPGVTVDSLVTGVLSPEITGTVTDFLATVSVTIGGQTIAAFVDVDSSWSVAAGQFTGLTPGSRYDVQVSATNALGSTGNDLTVNELWIISPPVVTVNSLQTSNVSPGISGTIISAAAATVSVSIDGEAHFASVNADSTWSIASGTFISLGEGVYDVVATAENPAGQSTDGTSDELTIDASIPSVTVERLATGNQSPELTGRVSGTSLTVSVTIDGETHSATVNADSTWVVPGNTFSSLAVGVYDVQAAATNEVGSTGYDETAGELIIVSVAVVTVNVLETSSMSPALSGTVSDSSATVIISIGGEEHEATVDPDGTWRILAGTFSALNAGVYDVVATASNPAGQATDITADELVIITSIPLVTIEDVITNDPTPELSGSVNDPAAAVVVSIGGANYTAVNNGNGTWALSGDSLSALSEDSLEVIVSATNQVNLVAYDTALVVVDLTAPRVLSFSPDTSSKADVNTVLSLTFDENIYAGSGHVVLYRADGSQEVFSIAAGSGQVNGQGTTRLQISLNTNLDSSTAYYVLVDDSAFTDLSGNNYAGISGSGVWTFTTLDPGDPVIRSMSYLTQGLLYKAGDTVLFSIDFSDSVTLSGGDLLVTLETGLTDREVTAAASATLSDSLLVAYVVQYGDSADPLQVVSLALRPGASLRNAGGEEVVLNVGQSNNLPQTVRADGVPPQLAGVGPGTNAVAFYPYVSYTLTEDLLSGSVLWSDAFLGGLALEPSVREDSVLSSEDLMQGAHEVRLPGEQLVTGARYTVSISVTDSAGNRQLVIRDNVKLASDVDVIRISPADTSIPLGSAVQFSLVGTDTAGGEQSDVILDSGITWRADGLGNINDEGIFTLSGLGECLVIAEYDGLSDTARVVADSGSFAIEPGGDTSMELGRDVELIFPPLASLEDSLKVNVNVLESSSRPSALLTAGPALIFQDKSTGAAWATGGDRITLRLQIDTSNISAGDYEKVQVYYSADGIVWTRVSSELEESWLVFTADTLGTFLVAIDNQEPVLTLVSSQTAANTGGSISFAYQATDNIANPDVRLRVGMGGAGQDSVIALAYHPDEQQMGEIPAGMITDRGLWYTVEIWDGANLVSSDTLDVIVTVTGGLSSPDSLPEGGYHMVSVPLNP